MAARHIFTQRERELSACSACIVFLYLRYDSCFVMLWTNGCGSSDEPETQQMLEAFPVLLCFLVLQLRRDLGEMLGHAGEPQPLGVVIAIAVALQRRCRDEARDAEVGLDRQ